MDDITIKLDLDEIKEEMKEIDDRPIYELVVRTPELMTFAVIVPHDTLDKLNSDKEYKSYTFVTLEDDEEIDVPSGAIVDYRPSKYNSIDINKIGELHI